MNDITLHSGVKKPLQGVGIGIRSPHMPEVLATLPALDWFEALADNFLQPDSAAKAQLLALRQHYPIALHSVGLSLGSTAPLNKAYLRRYRALIDEIKPSQVSDHLCWVSTDAGYLHELLPLPFNQATVDHVADRIKAVQDFFGCQIAVENVSSYLQFHADVMPEWAFMNAVAEQADCQIIFDVNNVFVNACNHGIDSHAYIDHMLPERISYVHLAGHRDMGTYLLDAHDDVVADGVWALYRRALTKLGRLPTLIEWDAKLPAFSILAAEADKARAMMVVEHV